MMAKLRKLNPKQRLKQLEIPSQLYPFIAPNDQNLDLASTFSENTIGVFPTPLGIVEQLVIDSIPYTVPLATEEASVIASANYGAKLIGNISTKCDHALQVAQVSLVGVNRQGEQNLLSHLAQINDALMTELASLHARGGGLRDVSCSRVSDDIYVVYITVDVCDAQGANIVNTAAESCAALIAQYSNAKVLAAICSNHNPQRIAQAKAQIPIAKIPSSPRYNHKELAQRICLLSQWANADVYRTSTHNKGIMNGISALALATGNDTRALEAASHTHSLHNSKQALSDYHIRDDQLIAKLSVPAILATVGGATAHPVAAWSLQLLAASCPKQFHAHHLNRIAAGLGLAQNFAALRALADEGIQQGHMKLHLKKSKQTHEPKK